MNVLFSAVYILVSFEMPFHPPEISVLGDYLRLEGNKAWKICLVPRDLTNRIFPDAWNLTKNFSLGSERGEFDRFLKLCPGVARGDGNAWN